MEEVVLCWAEPGDVNGRFMDSVLQLLYEDRDAVAQGFKSSYSIMGHTYLETGPRIASARNALVKRFLEQEAWKDVEWLLMLDSDMVFDRSLLHRLFDGVRDDEGNLKRVLVGGLCFGGGHGSIIPTMYRIVDPTTNNGSAIAVVTDYKEGEVVKVDATGAACLLIHRGVLETMAKVYEEPCKWFADSVYKGMDFGEDWTFCMRARMQGFEIFVNTAAKIGHMKPVELNEEMWKTGTSGLKSIAAFGSPEAIKEMSKLPAPQKLNREQRRRLERTK